MLYVVEPSRDVSTPESVLGSVHSLSGNLQFQLKDIILAVCGTVACMFTLCMLVTFTRCCCKKQKDESDEEQQPRSQHRSLWRRSWKRPAESAASTTQTQESSTSENVTQVTIERHGSHADVDSGDDEDSGGFTKGRGPKDSTRSGQSSRKGKENSDTKNALSVRDRIKAFEVSKPEHQEVKVREGAKPRKNKPTSKAFEEFESKGILIGFGGGPRRRRGEDGEDEDEAEDPDGSRDSPVLGMVLPSPTSGLSQEDTPTSSRGLDEDEGVHTMESEEDELSAVQRNTDILKSFRRAPPPKNRSKARRSCRGRRPLRQDMSSSEQIAEEPSSGSFGSRPTSGINSPETSATPDEEEHDSFEASLHMPTTESLSAARSSSISQTPQSSLDSMDSPKRQPSLSSRDSPLRTSLTDSPKRQGLLDSPKWSHRESPKRSVTPQRLPDVESPTATVIHPGMGVGVSPVCGSGGDLQWQQTQTQNGHTEFSLTIPQEFQQQRLGTHLTPDTGRSGLKPHRPQSYHIDVATNRGEPHIPVEKFRPIRPFSHVQIEADPGTSSQKDSPGCQERRLHDDPRPHRKSHDPNRLHSRRPNESMSRSHGHLARNTTSPIGRGVPYLPRSGSPAALRRWDSEYTYMKDDLNDQEGQSRDYTTDSVDSTPDYRPVGRSRTDRHKLRPGKDDSRVKEHPHSEKLERKVLPGETPASPYYSPDQWLQGENAVQTSDATNDITDDEAPPRPPPPCWRQGAVDLQPAARPPPRHAPSHHHYNPPPTTPDPQHHHYRPHSDPHHHRPPPDPQHHHYRPHSDPHHHRPQMRPDSTHDPGMTPRHPARDQRPLGLYSYGADLHWQQPTHGTAERSRRLVAEKGTNQVPATDNPGGEAVLAARCRHPEPASQSERPSSYRHSKDIHRILNSNRVIREVGHLPTTPKDDVLQRHDSTDGKSDGLKPELLTQENNQGITQTPPLRTTPEVLKSVEPKPVSVHNILGTHAMWEKSKELQPPAERRSVPQTWTERRAVHTPSWKDSDHRPGEHPGESLPGGRDQTSKDKYDRMTVRQSDGHELNVSQSEQLLHFHGSDWASRTKHHAHWGPESPLETTQGRDLWLTSTAQTLQGQGSRSQTGSRDSTQRSSLEYKKPASSSVPDQPSPGGSTPDPWRSRTGQPSPDSGTQGPQRSARLAHGPLLFKPEPRPSTDSWPTTDSRDGPSFHRQRAPVNLPPGPTDPTDTRDVTNRDHSYARWEPSRSVHLPNRQRFQSSLPPKEPTNVPLPNLHTQGSRAQGRVDGAGDDGRYLPLGGDDAGNSLPHQSYVKWDTSQQLQYPHRHRPDSSIPHPSDLSEDEAPDRWHHPRVKHNSDRSEQGMDSDFTKPPLLPVQPPHLQPVQLPHLQPVQPPHYPPPLSSSADPSDYLTSIDSVDAGLPWQHSPGGDRRQHVFRFNFDTKPSEV